MGSLLFSMVSTTANIGAFYYRTKQLALLLTCDSLGGELVHLGAGRDRLHTEGVHHQDPPLYLARLLVVVLHGVPDDIVHDT